MAQALPMLRPSWKMVLLSLFNLISPLDFSQLGTKLTYWQSGSLFFLVVIESEKARVSIF
jgi:hypothetical protein